MFLFIIMGATHSKAPAGFAPIAIGLGLTLIHLVGIPITNTSVDPARSTGPAIFVGGWALAQLWLFWVAPIVGGLVYVGSAKSRRKAALAEMDTRIRCKAAMTFRVATAFTLVSFLPLVAAADESAQPTAPETEPQGTVGAQAPATTGTTEVEGSGKFAAAAAVDEATADDATEFNLGAGGLLSTGNARAGSVTGTTNLRLRRKKHQFSAAFAANYGRAAADAVSDVQTTVHNEQGRVRYDYFVHPRISLFAMLTARHDPFQGLEARVNVDPGVAFYLLNDKRNRLWTEVGYDFQFDRFTEEATFAKDEEGAIVLDDEGNPIVAIERQRMNHAVRLFGGYANNITDAATFSTGVEYLQSVQLAERWRVNWDVALTTQLVNRLAISFTFTARMDNDPAPGIRKVDTITAVSLICRIL